MNPQERFMERVYPEPNCGCWLWGGGVSTVRGRPTYGQAYAGNRRSAYAHRIAYQLFVGPIPHSDKPRKYRPVVMHSCDMPLCVNPEHLKLGTYKENSEDRDAKRRNRFVCGSSHVKAKLREDDIGQIRKAAIDGVSYKRLARVYCVAPSTIGKVVVGSKWRHV